MVVRRDDITTTSSAKKRGETQRGNTWPRRGRAAIGELGENHAPGEILQKCSTSIRNPTVTRTSHATEGIQWIRMEELGKALTNRCRSVRELPNKNQKKQEETRDRNTNSELLNLGASSSQKLFQSLITNQDLLWLRDDMWPSHRTEQIELQAKLLNYFLGSNKSNINQ